MKYFKSKKLNFYNNPMGRGMFNKFNFLNSHSVNYSFIKTIFRIAIWIGLVLFSIFFLVYIGALFYFNFANLPASIPANKVWFIQFLTIQDLFSWKFIWILIIPGAMIAHIYFSIVLLMFLHRLSDEEMEQNKWLLIFLAIHLTFGFWLSFLITRFKNNETKSSFDSKKTISEIYSKFWIIKYSIVLALSVVFLIKVLFFATTQGYWTTQNYVLCPLIITLIFSLLTIGILTHHLFKDETINTQINNKTAKGRLANFFAYVALIFVLAKLAFTIFQSCLKIIGLFTNSGGNNNNYGGGFFSFFYRLMMLGLTIFYIKILADTFGGIKRSYKKQNHNIVYLKTIPHPKQLKQFEGQNQQQAY